jgi:MFS family permease
MSAIASAAPLVHGLIVGPIVWGLLRFLTGFCLAALYFVIESWLNERSTNAKMAAWFMAAAVIGGAILQWALGLLSDALDTNSLSGVRRGNAGPGASVRIPSMHNSRQAASQLKFGWFYYIANTNRGPM